MPTFPGGMPGLMQVVRDNIRYPASALKDEVSGRVVVQFTVDTLGNATNVRVSQGVRADLDAEATRLAGLFNGWTPAWQAGRKVPVLYTVPITFSIKDAPVSTALVADSLDVTPAVNKVIAPIMPGWAAGKDALPADKGVVYGVFIQRLGFSSGGIGQYVRLYHLGTGRVMNILVKPVMKSRKDNEFCVALPPGRYALQAYQYNGAVDNIRKSRRAGAVAATRYTFTVEAGQLQYVGTWHFEQAGPPRFTDDKAVTDEHLRDKFDKLPFGAARTTLPK
ncbi:energy transducer TonB [Hymenobacter sp. CRA2]|uniref:energy transducer TonB n=1 Tax=Hymenobacter sp. CRA2 TaxID=1955620 RepID=UPI001590810A|nr:energy transducer TonB [Hymenobacter sp. CRA2]